MIRIAGLASLSLVDVPGHPAITLFTRGCNLRCPYCQNASLVRGRPTNDDPSPESVLALLRRRRRFIDHVCVTGGEPTLHPDLEDFLRNIRGLGYRVKLDTNGSRPHVLARILQQGLVDYVAMDVKTQWNHYHRVGAPDPAPFQTSAQLIQRFAPDYEFRTTVVPGIVEPSDLLAIGHDLAGSRRYVLQQFLPRPDLLDPSWAHVIPYSDAQIADWAASLAPLFATVEVRNLGARPAR